MITFEERKQQRKQKEAELKVEELDREIVREKVIEQAIRETFSYTLGDEVSLDGRRYFDEVYTAELEGIVSELAHYLHRLENLDYAITVFELKGVLMYLWDTLHLDSVEDLSGFDIMAQLIMENTPKKKSIEENLDILLKQWKGIARDFTPLNVRTQLDLGTETEKEIECILDKREDLFRQKIIYCPNNHKGVYDEYLDSEEEFVCHVCGESFLKTEGTVRMVYNFKEANF